MPVMIVALPEDEPRYLPLPAAARQGIGLCLSGGGYRATLFHLGALRRLNELGILSRADFRTVSSVSGGSMAAAHLATALATKIGRVSGPIPDEPWDRHVRDPLRAFTRRNIRTGAVARRLLPWNWLRDSTAVEALAAACEKHLTSLKLAALPASPNFTLCATDMAYGVNWTFARDKMGSYEAGYMPPPPDWPLARAAAASACFPPVFDPLPLRLKPEDLKQGKAPSGPQRDACIRGLRLTDGGDYDNMGLEPVWKNHAVVLVSDAGGLFTAEGDKGLAWRIPRYQGIQERQARALRKRWLVSSFINKVMKGAYWGVGSAPSRYGRADGYSKELALQVIAEIRTDLDAFSDPEAAVLENHGYFLADAAIRSHVPDLLPNPVPPVEPPHPDWHPPRKSEAAIREELKDSGKRTALGRWH